MITVGKFSVVERAEMVDVGMMHPMQASRICLFKKRTQIFPTAPEPFVHLEQQTPVESARPMAKTLFTFHNPHKAVAGNN